MTSSDRLDISDLESARELSRRLTTAALAPSPQSATPFVRFRASTALGKPPQPEPEPGPNALPPGLDPTLTGGALWNQLLDWCRATAQAETAFVMDAYGLVVGSRGPLQGEQFEEVGARLILILDQARQMQPIPELEPAIGVELGTRWLTGFQAPLEDGTPLTIGLIGREAIPEKVRATLKRVVRARLGLA